MGILQYLLIAFLVLVTVANIYTMTIGKKNRQRASANYKITLHNLDVKTKEYMQEFGYHFDEKQGYINDAGDGFLLNFDTKKQVVGITLTNEFFHFPYADFVSCKQSYETLENGKLSNISVVVETNEEVITLRFGTKDWKEKSYLGKFLLQDTLEFCSILDKHCKPNA